MTNQSILRWISLALVAVAPPPSASSDEGGNKLREEAQAAGRKAAEYHATLPADVIPPPSALVEAFHLSPFYKKCRILDGLPILASEKVSDDAIREAAFIVNKMLADRDDVRAA